MPSSVSFNCNNIPNIQAFHDAEMINLEVLINRKRGQLFCVEGNQLKVMGVWQKLRYCFSKNYREKTIENVKNIIDGLTAKIGLDGSDKITPDKKSFLKTLFFETLAPMSRKIYQRKLSDSVIHILGSEFAEHLLPIDASEQYKTAYKAAQLSCRLGNYEVLKGCALSYRVYETSSCSDSKTLGIFKPASADTLMLSNPKLKQKIRALYMRTLGRPFSGSLLKMNTGQAFVAEAAAATVAKFMRKAIDFWIESVPSEKLCPDIKEQLKKLAIVPETHVAQFSLKEGKEELGSFQLWVQDKHQEACQFLGTDRYYNAVSESDFKEKIARIPPEFFDLLVILDYVTANADRHAENWFLTLDDRGNVKGIVAIDGGRALGPKHPAFYDRAELKKLYMWKKLPSADQPFTPLGRMIIKYINANKFTLAAELQQLYETHLPKEGKLAKKRANRCLERISVLHNYQNKTKLELAQVCLKKDIRALS